MQSDIMDLQNTVRKLMARQQDQPRRGASPEQGPRPVQPGAKATALQPLEDMRMRQRSLPHPLPGGVRQQVQQQPPDGLQAAGLEAAANDKQL